MPEAVAAPRRAHAPIKVARRARDRKGICRTISRRSGACFRNIAGSRCRSANRQRGTQGAIGQTAALLDLHNLNGALVASGGIQEAAVGTCKDGSDAVQRGHAADAIARNFYKAQAARVGVAHEHGHGVVRLGPRVNGAAVGADHDAAHGGESIHASKIGRAHV